VVLCNAPLRSFVGPLRYLVIPVCMYSVSGGLATSSFPYGRGVLRGWGTAAIKRRARVVCRSDSSVCIVNANIQDVKN